LGHLLAVLRTSAVYCLFGTLALVYQLTKPVGHQTPSMSCPTTYDAHKNICWSKTRWCVLGFCVWAALKLFHRYRPYWTSGIVQRVRGPARCTCTTRHGKTKMPPPPGCAPRLSVMSWCLGRLACQSCFGASAAPCPPPHARRPAFKEACGSAVSRPRRTPLSSLRTQSRPSPPSL
jgi:hypothetical protein